MNPAEACKVKRVYLEKAHAKRAARRFHSQGRKLGRPYRCPACGLWHLTTANADQRHRNRAAGRST